MVRMGSTEATTALGSARRPGLGVVATHVAALAIAGGLVAVTASWNHWSFAPLAAIAMFAVGSDLTSVQSDSRKMKISGVALGTVLAAVRFGGAPAASIGLLTGLVGWLRWREAPHYLRNNLVTFAWGPLAAGLFFGAASRLAHVTSGEAAYYFLVLPTFLVALFVNFTGVIGYQCYLDGSSMMSKAREVLVPILSAELFSAVLTAIAVYFVVKTGTIGVGVLLVTLAIFQYLVGELLTSQRRARGASSQGDHRRAHGSCKP